MKFYCDKCQTKYSIPDEKVRGKVLKIRCKKCEHIITVREMSVPASVAVDAPSRSNSAKPSPPPLKPPALPPEIKWHYALNGQTFGPFGESDLKKKFSTGAIGDEVYLWNESLTDWLPAKDVAAFKEVLRQGNTARPRSKTIGFTGRVEAISRESQPINTAKEELASNIKASASHAPVKSAERKASKATASPSSQNLDDKLHKLRARLNRESSAPKSRPSAQTDFAAADDETMQSVSIPRELSPLVRGSKQPEVQQQEHPSISLNESAPKDPLDQVPDIFSPDSPNDEELTLDTSVGVPDSSSRAPLQSVEDETLNADPNTEFSPAFEQSSEDETVNSVDADDLAPLLAQAPKLESKAQVREPKSSVEDVSASLLMQLQSISKQGRGKKVALVFALTAGLCAVVVGMYYFTMATTAEESTDTTSTVKPELVAQQEPEEKEVVEPDVVAEVDEEVDAEVSEEEATAPLRERRVAAPKRSEQGADLHIDDHGSDPFEEAMDGAVADARAKGSVRRTQESRSLMRSSPLDSSAASVAIEMDNDRFRAMGSLPAASRDAPIYNPTEALRDTQRSSSQSGGLTAEQATEGMRSIRRSVSLCHERHMRYGIPLDTRKVYVSVTVRSNGRVQKYSIEPRSVQGTEFDRCMQSHTGRWRFAEFSGKSAELRAPFVLQ